MEFSDLLDWLKIKEKLDIYSVLSSQSTYGSAWSDSSEIEFY